MRELTELEYAMWSGVDDFSTGEKALIATHAGWTILIGETDGECRLSIHHDETGDWAEIASHSYLRSVALVENLKRTNMERSTLAALHFDIQAG
jgi:hypothetical protein